MSQKCALTTGGSGGAVVETLTGNVGGAVGPDGSFNINIIGNNATGINVIGMPGTNTLTITSTGITIAGDTGSISGTNLTIFANQAIKNCGQSVSFDNLVTTSTMSVTDSSLNTIIGKSSGAAPGAGVQNTALGFSNLVNQAGNDNTAIGIGIMNGNPIIGSRNIGIGSSPLSSLASGNDNIALGFQTGQNLTSGSNNVLIGPSTATLMTTGSTNIIISADGTFAYTGAESNNVLLGNDGITGDANKIRIGTQGAGSGQQNECYIAGIASVSVANTEMVTINTSTGQMGSQTLPISIVWSDNSGSFNAASNNGYFITTTSTPTLPAAPSEGDVVAFIVDTTNICTITANTGQKIRVGITLSASAGTCASNFRGDSINLVYRSTGATWFASSSPQGTWSVT
jgi:hypothetical protein